MKRPWVFCFCSPCPCLRDAFCWLGNLSLSFSGKDTGPWSGWCGWKASCSLYWAWDRCLAIFWLPWAGRGGTRRRCPVRRWWTWRWIMCWLAALVWGRLEPVPHPFPQRSSPRECSCILPEICWDAGRFSGPSAGMLFPRVLWRSWFWRYSIASTERHPCCLALRQERCHTVSVCSSAGKRLWCALCVSWQREWDGDGEERAALEKVDYPDKSIYNNSNMR